MAANTHLAIVTGFLGASPPLVSRSSVSIDCWLIPLSEDISSGLASPEQLPMDEQVTFVGALSKVIPRHTRTVRFHWCKRDFQLFGFFKAARSRMGLSILQGGRCYWCHRPFHDDDMMALAAPEKGANKLLCQTCAGQLIPTPSAGAPRVGD